MMATGKRQVIDNLKGHELLALRMWRFTMVELLTVVAILLILVAMLMPSLERARESTRRTVCASNLKQWGNVSFLYFGDHNRKLPQSMIFAGGTNYDYCHPHSLNNNAAHYNTPTEAVRGTPYPTLRDNYGLDSDVMNCPSRDLSMENHTWAGYTWDPDEKLHVKPSFIIHGYAYMARAQSAANAAHKTWSVIPPANLRDETIEPVSSVIAADSIIYNAFTTTWQANHDRYGIYQGMLMGDGHVTAHRQGAYTLGANHALASSLNPYPGAGSDTHWLWEGSPKVAEAP